jgi:hypothetical protein
MANFIVRNSLNPYKIIKIGVTFNYVVPKNNEGEPIWVVELATYEKDVSGNSIPPEYITVVSLDNIDQEIQNSAAIISDKVDWGALLEDRRSPTVVSHSPTTNAVNVDIYQNVIINLIDIFPSEGIDINSINISVNDIDVTSEIVITGNPYNYTIMWKPDVRILTTYL